MRAVSWDLNWKIDRKHAQISNSRRAAQYFSEVCLGSVVDALVPYLVGKVLEKSSGTFGSVDLNICSLRTAAGEMR
jgi:hypothetical protein